MLIRLEEGRRIRKREKREGEEYGQCRNVTMMNNVREREDTFPYGRKGMEWMEDRKGAF